MKDFKDSKSYKIELNKLIKKTYICGNTLLVT